LKRTNKSPVKRKMTEQHSSSSSSSDQRSSTKSGVNRGASSSSGVSNPKQVRQEKQHQGVKKPDDRKDEGKKEDAKDVIWNDKNCDHDLDDHAASNVHTRKIKISSNLLLSCKMISHLENKHLTQDYAALVFSRKTNKDKVFDFMIDLRVTERLIRALQIIMDENPVFFNKRTLSVTHRS